MPLWFWGAVTIGATCGWLCGMLLMPEPALKRSQLLVLAAMSVTAAAIHLMFGPAAVIGFGGSALIFHLLQTGWHRAPGAAGSS